MPSSSTSSSSSWWRILAGNPHDCCWSYFPFMSSSSSEECIPCLPCSCPPCPTESFWVRPEEWPALPEFSSDVDQRIVGLVAVEDTDLETLAILCQGAYTVDWGDGSAPENVASGVKAQHQYTYASLSGDPLSYGYKTVIVTVTPQAGSNLTAVDFTVKHSLLSSSGFSIVQKWLDIDLSVPYCTGYSLLIQDLLLIERIIIRDHALTSGYELFKGNYSLMSVDVSDTSAFTETTDMFMYCRLLQSVPLFDTSSATDTSAMFAACYSLLCIPEFNLSAASNIYGMFDSCYALTCVPMMDTSKATDISVLFNYCLSLVCVPKFDTSSATDAYQMFNAAASLCEVPLFDFSNVDTLYIMFAFCPALAHIPAFNTSSCTNMDNAFGFCESLTQLPEIDGSAINFTVGSQFSRRSRVISRSKVYGVRYGPATDDNYIYRPLSAAALNEIFTNLGVAAGTQYIKVTGCYGAADPACDRTIATVKGWTVIG